MKRTSLILLIVLVLVGLACVTGNPAESVKRYADMTETAAAMPTSTVQPPVEPESSSVGCPAIIDATGYLWFDDQHEGIQVTIMPDGAYEARPDPYRYLRATCVSGYPIVVVAFANTTCIPETIQYYMDGGWSCMEIFEGITIWTAVVGGDFLFPLGPPPGWVRPTPIVPPLPTAPQPGGKEG